MRIVQLGPMPPPHGGVSTNMMAIHHMLTRLGHSSRIIDVTNRGAGSEAVHVLKPRTAVTLVKMLLQLECDIVHYHIGGNFTSRLSLLTLFCGMLPAKRSVVTFHSGGYARENALLAKPRSLRGLAFRSIDLVIGVNEQMREMFRAYGVAEERVRIIPPFDLQRPDPRISLPSDLEDFARRSKPFLLAVGALEPEYRNEFLIDAMAHVTGLFPNAGLMIVGSGSLRADLDSDIARTGLRDRIKMTGNLDRSIVLHLINRADTMLRITDYDGDSIALREALFMGTPVIASDNAHRPNGVLIMKMPPDPEQLTERLIEAKEVQLSSHAGEVADESNIRSVIKVYEELLAR